MSLDFKLYLDLKAAPWESEIDRGEAGIVSRYLIVDKNDNTIGSYVTWYDGSAGLFTGKYPDKITRVVLPPEIVNMLKFSTRKTKVKK